jgi:serine/threonine-protein kinase HipA
MREFGLPVAESAILKFGTQTVLSVKRFDRRWIGADGGAVERRGFKPKEGMWIARLPQEDFCQATGRPPDEKYEADGGPSIEEVLDILSGSECADIDRSNLVLAELAFWLLAATDGHAKNFSVHQSVGGAYTLTPFYDVLSAWPIIGPGANQLPLQQASLAMSMRGASPHYKLKEIQTRHWRAIATRVGVSGLWERMLELVLTAPAKIEMFKKTLPRGFPKRLVNTIESGVRGQVAKFSAGVGT